jgi:hypothetical protein
MSQAKQIYNCDLCGPSLGDVAKMNIIFKILFSSWKISKLSTTVVVSNEPKLSSMTIAVSDEPKLSSVTIAVSDEPKLSSV